MRKIAGLLLVTLLMAAGCASVSTPADPPSGVIDPMPGPLDYVHPLPSHTWTFGEQLWRSQAPCTADQCEAAYNASPLFLSVMKGKACCGGTNTSFTIVAEVKECARDYYLVWLDKMGRTRAERLALIARRTQSMVASLLSKCRVNEAIDVPTEPLSRLFE